ncbi:prepilin-type N-terminal cleavage/methylation domain-containing protein [Verminephrobacter aporrectodeae subsp. tuberculatae]|uniref:GspH/FimT family pseudopilin n=1 Tax=Verminephrobacter aporrectodeae TaxID=1110389 RepID=UPI0022445471|nr:GspH/FimT family pseudopilin [Verminephrobacter aporrectodeae]MCW8166981.1 prepilin-type N-terminal cleavage/methylation domain-containing protein [Verminephrobacter aporrectodeae subsp. tuberculatae]MCW8168286.1 prepilin-type N-terminal cleavage/methylation domain-containing protein [Verminephrobacter aporrectodeae subsp. tuberculatae]
MMHKRTDPSGRNGGFTLIELMITIALAAVLMTLAAPSFVQYQRNSELTSITNSLLTAINAAKSEAMKTGRNAFVRPRATLWTSGWIVYVDTNRDNTYTNGTDTTVQTQEAIKAYFNITSTGIAAGSTPYIEFNGSGYTIDQTGSPVALNLSIARTDAANASEETRRIVVARTGRVRACKPSADTSCTDSATE